MGRFCYFALLTLAGCALAEPTLTPRTPPLISAESSCSSIGSAPTTLPPDTRSTVPEPCPTALKLSWQNADELVVRCEQTTLVYAPPWTSPVQRPLAASAEAALAPSARKLSGSLELRRRASGFGLFLGRIGSEEREVFSFVNGDAKDEWSVSPNAQWLAAQCSFDSVCVWDVLTGTRFAVPGAFMPHTSRVLSLARSANADLLVTSSVDGMARAWDLRTGTLLSRGGLGALSTEYRLHLPPPRLGSSPFPIGPERTPLISVRQDGKQAVVESGIHRWSFLFRQSTAGPEWIHDVRTQRRFSPTGEYVLRDGVLSFRALSPEGQPRAWLGVAEHVERFVLSGDGSRAALQREGAEVELRRSSPPFTVLADNLEIGGLDGVDHEGRLVWGDRAIANIEPDKLYPLPAPVALRFGLRARRPTRQLVAFKDGAGLFYPNEQPEPGAAPSQALQVWPLRGQESVSGAAALLGSLVRTRCEVSSAANGMWGVGSNRGAPDHRLLFTSAPNWFAEVRLNGTIDFRRRSGSPIILSIRAVSERDAAYAYAPDGRYDFLGSEPEAAARVFRCVQAGRELALEDCNARREVGLVANVLNDNQR